ncbi:hypothetical protein EXS72_02885 [Candidatus Pacearchaeota archaeon]|nr:hypothetical protein [Candidatus Pacearchaeota archaeon]
MMSCKCSWVEAILAIVIILSAYLGRTSSKWVIIVSALILLLHALMCKKCGMCEMPQVSAKSTKKKRR